MDLASQISIHKTENPYQAIHKNKVQSSLVQFQTVPKIFFSLDLKKKPRLK